MGLPPSQGAGQGGNSVMLPTMAKTLTNGDHHYPKQITQPTTGIPIYMWIFISMDDTSDACDIRIPQDKPGIRARSAFPTAKVSQYTSAIASAAITMAF